MKNGHKILVVCVTFGLSAGIAYTGTIYNVYAVPCSLFSGAFAALGSAITGWTPTT
jgi:hypothetical protein